jgi:hypothetical protein
MAAFYLTGEISNKINHYRIEETVSKLDAWSVQAGLSYSNNSYHAITERDKERPDYEGARSNAVRAGKRGQVANVPVLPPLRLPNHNTPTLSGEYVVWAIGPYADYSMCHAHYGRTGALIDLWAQGDHSHGYFDNSRYVVVLNTTGYEQKNLEQYVQTFDS